MNPEFASLLSQHLGNSHAKQIAFAELIGKERNWGVDLSAGRVTFGHDLSYPIQLLGTEASGDASWLWAWANEQSSLPAHLLRVCNQIRAIGAERNIPEFTDQSFSLDRATGHMVATIASGLNPGCCYFRGPYDGGALFFLVFDVPAEVLGPVASERAVTVLAESISQFEVHHRDMAASFLRGQGFTLQADENLLQGTRGSDSIQVLFDSMGRIENVECKLRARERKTSRWWQIWKRE